MIIDPLGIVPIERGGTGATTAEEAKEKLGITSNDEGTVLFYNSSGVAGTITLNDNISNYSRAIVYSFGSCSTIVHLDYQKDFYISTFGSLTQSGKTSVIIYTYFFTFSGTRLVQNFGYEVTCPQNGYVTNKTTNLYITRVVGYK